MMPSQMTRGRNLFDASEPLRPMAVETHFLISADFKVPDGSRACSCLAVVHRGEESHAIRMQIIARQRSLTDYGENYLLSREGHTHGMRVTCSKWNHNIISAVSATSFGAQDTITEHLKLSSHLKLTRT
eukprot:Blabericola_migrator_1__2379@NODE_1668_length_4046_cov_38_827846_g347_i1_p3_GENE_NODE_1668_length_4046_cov_38_827846_g347_i1NODE_1668_length_4046_cov_38_827846_g347_i1_p3_ORF_typecomplete_len129_score11_50_NODE_1668_length_4046_cov_38_827846_g347_i17371123